MGKQINFYLHKKDMKSFYEILKKRKVIFLPIKFRENNVTILENIPDDLQENMKLVRYEDISKVKLWEITDGKFKGEWWVERKSPVVDLDNSQFREEQGILLRGRLYFQSDYLEEDIFIKHDETFIKWANSLLSDLRRNLIKRKEINGFLGTFYLGQYANEWVENNNAKVTSGGYVLESTCQKTKIIPQ